MDVIFKALADPARRALLDSLREKDGQTLTELGGQLDMTRFGVMKHLKVLEDASLIVTAKRGRFKYHYLNALPLQEAIDRWIDPLLAKPAARAVIDLKSTLESAPRTAQAADAKHPDFVHQTIIRSRPEAVWDALLSADATQNFYYGTRIEGIATQGQTLTYRTDDGGAMLTCDVLEADAPHRLDMTFAPHFLGKDAPVSRHVFVLENVPGGTRLTLRHFDLPAEMQGIRDGWVRILSGLKTWLETGEALPAATPTE